MTKWRWHRGGDVFSLRTIATAPGAREFDAETMSAGGSTAAPPFRRA